MYERLLMLILSHPRMLMLAGKGLLALGGLMTVLGLRFSRVARRATRIFERHAVEPLDLMSGVPWWLRMLVPETTVGWVSVLLVLAMGAYFVHLGKWAKKFQA